MEKDEWYKRFLMLIENDQRNMRELSLAAGCGQNYIQQMIKEGKRPSIDRFIAILNALEPLATLYIFTGLNISTEDLKFLQILMRADENKRKAILTLLEDNQSF